VTAPAIPRPPAGVVATGPKRCLFVALGFVFVGVAYLGALTPGLPTTPWVLLASYFFSRSSPRLQRWLWYSPYFGTLIRDWHHHRGMRRSAKLTAVTLMVVACTASIIFAGLPDWLRVVIGVCGMTGFVVVLFVVPTAPTNKSSLSGG
jgi:uncharacterized membrane protein YbaN (DUF454 family)